MVLLIARDGGIREPYCEVSYQIAFVSRGNWDKNSIESSFTPLDLYRRLWGHAIESYFVLSDYILHVIGSDFILLDRTSLYRMDRTSFYRIIYFMSLHRTIWNGLHVGSETSFDRASSFLKKFVSQSASLDTCQ